MGTLAVKKVEPSRGTVIGVGELNVCEMRQKSLDSLPTKTRTLGTLTWLTGQSIETPVSIIAKALAAKASPAKMRNPT